MTVKPTSIMAYRELIESGKAKTQRDKIFACLLHYTDHGFALCRDQIEEFTGIRINAVCGRVNELLEDGLVKVAYERESPKTGREVEFLICGGEK